MSDHELDAWESYDKATEECIPYSNDTCHDPYYYYSKIDYVDIKAETEKAYLFVVDEGVERDMWVPKALCRDHDVQTKTIRVLTEFLYNKLEEYEDG